MERIFLNVSEDRAERSGVFDTKFYKETFNHIEKDGKKKIQNSGEPTCRLIRKRLLK